jgi:hypothetical protein
MKTQILAAFTVLLPALFGPSSYCFAQTVSAEELDREIARFTPLMPKEIRDQLLDIGIKTYFNRAGSEREHILWDTFSSAPSPREVQIRAYLAKVGISEINEYDLIFLNKSFDRAMTLLAPRFNCARTNPRMTEAELQVFWKGLAADPVFRNEFPSALCYERAILIEQKLNEKGIAFQSLHLKGLISAAYAFGDGFKAVFFRDHVAPVVEVDSGRLMVLDPEFTEDPLPLDEYVSQTLYGDSSKWKLSDGTVKLLGDSTSRAECSFSSYVIEAARLRILGHNRQRVDHGGEVFKTRAEAITNERAEHRH